jgi:hypothetical protein
VEYRVIQVILATHGSFEHAKGRIGSIDTGENLPNTSQLISSIIPHYTVSHL